jgi:nucleotide-binding universal stress UspA family protein
MDAFINRIVVPVDFSESSERAVSYAAALARRLGASLHLIHALEPPALTRGPLEFYESASAEHLNDVYWTARRRLNALSQKLALRVATSKEVRPGLASEVITAAVIDLGADLVIMSTHGRTGLSHLLLGSVAEQVVRSAVCPVLMIRDGGQVHVHRPTSGESTNAADMVRAS